jgi:hypothetical protein
MDNDTFLIQNDYHEALVDYYIPKLSNSSKDYDRCYIKVYKNHTESPEKSSNYTKEKCKSWVYSNTIYRKTIVTDVCRF